MLAGTVADAIIARGLQGRVTLSHLCVLAALNPRIAGELIKKLARAEVTVVALPRPTCCCRSAAKASPIGAG